MHFFVFAEILLPKSVTQVRGFTPKYSGASAKMALGYSLLPSSGRYANWFLPYYIFVFFSWRLGFTVFQLFQVMSNQPSSSVSLHLVFVLLDCLIDAIAAPDNWSPSSLED